MDTCTHSTAPWPIATIDKLGTGLDLLKAAIMAAESLDADVSGPMSELLSHAYDYLRTGHDLLDAAHDATLQEGRK